jgi:large subunit ribosomal protein L13e
MTRHNNQLQNVHLRKHWVKFVKTWFNQPARKQRRALARQAKAARIFPRPLEKLRPVVHGQTRKYNSKVRYGRGFTLQEIKAAGLSRAFAQTVGIAVDHRRQNTSEEALQQNKQRLESYKSKMILFPRRESKPKKGEINDSTVERLQSADAKIQNIHSHVLEKPVRKLRESPRKITKELTDMRVYRKLRQLQVNAKNVGKREKRAKEAADKAALEKSKN